MTPGMVDVVLRLERIAGDIEGHIERRAWEITEPRVRQAHAAARELVEQAQAETRRQADLVEELRLHVIALEHAIGVRHHQGECDTCTSEPTVEGRKP